MLSSKKNIDFLISDASFSKIIVTTAILYLLKTAFWPLTYIFIVFYLIAVLNFIIRKPRKMNILGFVKSYLPPLILSSIIIIIVIINNDFAKPVIKDILLLLVMFSIFYLLHWNNEILRNNIPISYGLNLIIYINIGISILNLLNIFFNQVIPYGLKQTLNISSGPAIANDYNFFSLFILFGLIIINYPRNHVKIFCDKSSILKHAVNLLFILNVVLSSSRRGIVVLFILITIYLLIQFQHSKSLIKKWGFSKLALFVFLFLLVLFLSGLLIIRIIPKEHLNQVLYRYSTLIGYPDRNIGDKLIWKFNNTKPGENEKIIDKRSLSSKYKFWGESAKGTTLDYVETYYGTGIKLTRIGGPEGFSLNYIGPPIIYYADHTYKIRFKIKFISGNFSSFCVGWWINDGGRGYNNTLNLDKEIEPLENDWFQCQSYYTFLENHVGLTGFINTVIDNSSFIIADFELTDMNFNSDLPVYEYEYNGNEALVLWLDKINSPWNSINLVQNGDFTKGLTNWKCAATGVRLKIINLGGDNCLEVNRSEGDGGGWSLFYDGRDINYFADNEYLLTFKYKPINSNSIPFYAGFWLNEGNGYINNLHLSKESLEEGWIELTARYKFKTSHSNLLFPINSQLSNSTFYLKDIVLKNTTQIQYQSHRNLSNDADTIKNKTMIDEGRISRLNYALKLWNSEFKWYNKLFGHGFDFYKWYSESFYKNTGKNDYPHNPFISVVFYSGIIGLISYLWLLYYTLRLYLSQRKSCGITLIFFLITFFFSFFSGSTPFDPPIMGFFIFLPYYIRNHKNYCINE